MGNENTVYPLFGRKKYPNGDKWEYYTTIGQYGVKMPVVTQRTNTELGTNEIVFIQGQRKAPYRVTMYEFDGKSCQIVIGFGWIVEAATSTTESGIKSNLCGKYANKWQKFHK